MKVLDRNFLPNIKLGSDICKKIKNIYPEKSWFDIADVFTLAKQKARKIMIDHTESQMLTELSNYSEEDLKILLQEY